MGQGSGDDEVGGGEMVQGPEAAKIAVQEGIDEGSSQGPDHFAGVFDALVVGEEEEVVEVFDGEPVLLEEWFGQAGISGKFEGEFPESAIKVEEDEGMGMGEAVDVLEEELDIPEFAQEVGEDDDVEGFVEGGIVGVGGEEVKVGVFFLSLGDHLGGQVDADAMGGIEGGQEVASGAAEFEDAEVLWDGVLVEMDESLVVVGA